MHASDSVELRVLRQLAKRIKSDYATFVRGANPQEYLDRDIRPSDYSDPMSFADDWLLHNFLRKWKGWNTSKNARDVAIEAWKGAERQNYLTNCRLRTFERTLHGPALTRIISMRQKISKVLGDVPWGWIESHCKWSGGATFAHKRGLDSPDKQERPIDVTEPALNLCRSFLDDPITSDLHYGDIRLVGVKGNRCVTVPKTAKTDRMIACEPSGNAWLQQGVGRWIRSRLKTVRVDLDNQGRNQELAFNALLDQYATIDLKMASDTMSQSVVELLLPREWFDLMNRLRSHYSYLDGKWYYLEKFTSMGNAFNFELESLIFWAICTEVCGDQAEISVYGDDLIIESKYYSEVVAALNFFGFTVNEEKSFTEGSLFFESCGKHYHSLEDVTPAYQKEVCRKPEDYVRFHNRLWRWAYRTKRWHIVKDALFIIRKCYSEKFKGSIPVIPPCELDSGFIETDMSIFKRDIHGDFRCVQLLLVEPKVLELNHRFQAAALAIKLRDPSFSNQHPDGWCSRRRKGRYRLVRRRLWAASLYSHWSPDQV